MTTQTATLISTLRLKNFHFAPKPAANAGKPQFNVAAKPTARLPLPAFQRARLRAKVAAVTCSEPWTELAAASAEKQGIDPNLASVARQLADRDIYPPRSEPGPDRLPRRGAVRMRRCDACGRMVPPNNVASYRLVRLCDDCRIEPDIDPDERADAPDSARAPGAQFGLLVEGLVEHDAKRHAVREQLNQIGLTDPEIMAMAFTHCGYSTRRVAELGRWSQTYVRKLLTSAARKLRRSGLSVPKARAGELNRSCTIDPVKLDGMTQHVV